jgi:hypothetical protein
MRYDDSKFQKKRASKIVIGFVARPTQASIQLQRNIVGIFVWVERSSKNQSRRGDGVSENKPSSAQRFETR